MKVYYLRLTQDDFDQADNVWSSEVIDLYNNSGYKNYSTTKSNYGLDSLGDRTWTGLTTDDGLIDGSRYIDYTGRIDIINYVVNFSDLPGNGDIVPRLNIYHIDNEDDDFPDEWASQLDNFSTDNIFLVDAYRYAKFILNLDTDLDVSNIGVELLIRVEIDIPTMAPKYDRTTDLLNTFPEWMAIREIDDQDSATPVSVGGKLINAVAGQWLEDIADTVNYLELQQFITTADEGQVAWVYAAWDTPDEIWSITGDGVDLARTASLNEFYEVSDSDDAFHWEKERGVAFVNKEYDELLINGDVYTLAPQHIWNWFDEFGVLVDLKRHKLEDNVTFKARILDTHQHRPGVALDNFKFALRRELNLWQSFGATPDYSYPGATPEVLEILDIENDIDGATPYMGYDSVPTARFESLVEELATKYPTTWGYFRWNKAYWDIGGTENKGYGALAYRYDATPLTEPDAQSGVGDGNDLLVYRPDELEGTNDFEARLKLRGLEKSTRNEYRKVDFLVEFWGEADIDVYDNPETTHWLTIRIVDNQSTPTTYYHSFELSATSDISPANASNTTNSYVTYDIWNVNGALMPDLIWVDAAGNEYDTSAATPFQLDYTDIEDMDLYYGQWNPDTDTFDNQPASLTSRAWWSDASASKLNSNSISNLNGTLTTMPYVVFESLDTDSATGTWVSDVQTIEVSINGVLPDQTEQALTIDVPTIVWDDNIDAGTEQYAIKISTTNEDGDFGGYTTGLDGDPLFLDGTNLALNGVAYSDSVDTQYLDDSETELEFSTVGDWDIYPIEVSTWDLFEAEADFVVEGTVDENGPWRNGVPSVSGNTNYNLEQVEVARSDFGVDDDEDHIITWMGIDVLNNGNVIAWLDTNTVKPAIESGGSTVVYPDNAIVEELDGGNYVFAPFVVRARLRPGMDPHWYPQVHSGWFYDRNDEYYFYTNSLTEDVDSATPVLTEVSRQGAPIIVKADDATPIVEFRQVAFVADSATPVLGLVNTEETYGSGTNALYLAYEDVYDVTVVDQATGETVGADTDTPTHVLNTDEVTDREKIYEVTYTLDNSFYANNEYVHSDGSQRTELIFDKHPSELGVSSYRVVYESAIHDSATPINVPLNTFHTVQDEGFVFISFDEYTLSGIEVRISPSKVVADGQDYLLISIKSLDQYGNSKASQSFAISTTWGVISAPSNNPGVEWDGTTVTTNEDGFAVLFLTAEETTDTLTGTISIDGDVSTEAAFEIQPLVTGSYRLVALPSADRVPADGSSVVVVYGSLEDDTYAPVPNATVFYRKARSVYELFTMSYDGSVETDANGRFTVGPFSSATPSDTGYWFVAVESATPDVPDPVGDVVVWHEYPDIQYGVEDITGLPMTYIQAGNTPGDNPSMGSADGYPVNYDDATPYADATPVTINWEPPAWYAIPRYIQYQLGFLGTDFYGIEFDDLQDTHPDYRDM